MAIFRKDSMIPTFCTRESVTLIYTLSISHSPRPLAVGHLRNAKIMEFVLAIQATPTVENLLSQYR